MKIKKNLLLWTLLILLIIIPLVSAAQTIQTNVVGTKSIQIAYPKLETFKINSDFYLHFHIYNSSGAFLSNSTTTCLFHLYNSSGEHIIQIEKMLYDKNEKEFEVKLFSNNLSGLGRYPYIIQCNSTQGEYGYDDLYFDITETGREEINNVASLVISSFAVLIALILFLLPFLKPEFIKYPITNLILRRSCWVVSCYLMVLNCSIIGTIIQNTGYNLTSNMTTYMFLFGTMGYVLIFLLFIGTVFSTIIMWNERREQKRNGF